MGTIATTANSVFRDYSTDGVPSSGPQNPVKTDIRSLFGVIDASVRICATAPVVVQVGFPGAVDSATSTNCATVKQALYNLMNNYDHKGFTPTIQCAGPTSAGGGGSVQTYYGGCVLSYGDLPYATATPQFVGTMMLVLDLGGSILDGAPSSSGGTGYTVCLRMCPLALQIQNGTFQQASGGGSILYAYGGNSQIEIGPAVTIGQFGANGSNTVTTGAFVMQATRGGAIRLRPGLSGANRLVFSLGTGNTTAALFTSLITGGSIELEGSEIYCQGSTTFVNGVFNVSILSQVSLSNTPWTGSTTAFLGPQWVIQSGGSITTNDSKGGQVMTIPANPQTGTSQTTVTSNVFTAVPGSNYFPGSQPGYIVGAAEIDYWPDLPPASASAGTSFTAGAFTVGHAYTITSIGTTDFTLIGATSNTLGLVFVATGAGSGTGTARDYVLQGAEPAITFGIGSGATSPVTITMGSTTNWRNVTVSTNNAAALPNLSAVFVGPANYSTPGYVVLSWTGTYSGGALGAYVYLQLMNGIPQ